ncbi:hypothetical protein TIFTF001_035458 [Ficus carica]|uniref:Uncharacterized protein n=1 Tax=Ficus carica TaxID=3494 RepID=A0AA88E5M8_FICCA|nr:hypothetical protein TIFTF001_035458 [Ficus carica]
MEAWPFHDGLQRPSWKHGPSTTVSKDRRGSYGFHYGFRKLYSAPCFYRIFHDGFLKNGRGSSIVESTFCSSEIDYKGRATRGQDLKSQVVVTSRVDEDKSTNTGVENTGVDTLRDEVDLKGRLSQGLSKTRVGYKRSIPQQQENCTTEDKGDSGRTLMWRKPFQ